MSKSFEDKFGSLIYGRLNAARMSSSERETAVSAMQTASLIVDLIVWVTKKIEQMSIRTYLRPSLKH